MGKGIRNIYRAVRERGGHWGRGFIKKAEGLRGSEWIQQIEGGGGGGCKRKLIQQKARINPLL